MPSLDLILRLFPTEDDFVLFLFEGSGARDEPCPGCQKNTRWLQRRVRVFMCSRCAHAISPTASTMFSHTHIDLRLWLFAILLLAQSPRLLPGSFLGRILGISRLAAQGMREKLWRRMGVIAERGPIGGPGVHVEIDEVLISRYVKRRSTDHRLSVLGITDRKMVRTFVVHNRRRDTLLPLILANVADGSIINTDGFASYKSLSSHGFKHLSANHAKGIFCGADGARTTSIDAYWRDLKHALRLSSGVSESRLPIFLKAHACRYSFRDRPEGFISEMLGSRALVATARATEKPVMLPRTAGRTRAARNSYFSVWEPISDEKSASELLGRLALSRISRCAQCKAKQSRRLDTSGKRLFCSACRSRPSVRKGSIFEDSRIPLHLWLRLIRLMTLSDQGISIAFAAAHLGVSKQGAGHMLRTIRSAMASHQQGLSIGGAGTIVHVGAFKFRVRAPREWPRRTSKTVIVATDGAEFLTGVLRKNYAFYVRSWLRKHVRAGSIVRHPDERRFATIASGDWVALPETQEETFSSPCKGIMTTIKSDIKLYHLLPDYDRLELFLKEREFKAWCSSFTFEQLVAALSFPKYQ